MVDVFINFIQNQKNKNPKDRVSRVRFKQIHLRENEIIMNFIRSALDSWDSGLSIALQIMLIDKTVVSKYGKENTWNSRRM